MAKIDGRFVVVKIGGAIFTGQTQSDLSLEVNPIAVTTKDSNGHAEVIGGEDSGSITVAALYDPSGTYSLNEVFAAAQAKALVTAWIGGTVAGQHYAECSALISNVSWGNPTNGASTVNCTLTKSGAYTFGVVSDAVAPLLESAYINNATPTVLRLQFNETLDENYKPASSVWTIAGVSKTISSYSISGRNITITVTVAFAAGDAVTIAYTNPGSGGIRDISGNVLASFTAESVTNNVQ